MKKLLGIIAVLLALCLSITTVVFADEPAEPTPEEMARLKESTLGVLPFSQEFISWGWKPFGEKAVASFGETIECSWTNTQDIAVFGAEHTNNFTNCPNFVLQLSDAGFLKLPDGAQPGDTGDTAEFSASYTDIIITADGYDDVIVPGGEVNNFRLTIKQEQGWVSGTEYLIDMGGVVRKQLGLDIEAFCEYLKHVSSVTTSVTFTGFEGITQADVDAYYAAVEADDTAKLEELNEYISIIENAKAVVEDDSADLEAKKVACADAGEAVDKMMAEVEGLDYPKCEKAAKEMVEIVKDIQSTVTKMQAEANAAAAEEEKANKEENKPAASDNKPAASKESGSNAAVIIIIVAAVVVVAAIAVIAVVLGKKKK